jgi:hypothetical protein
LNNYRLKKVIFWALAQKIARLVGQLTELSNKSIRLYTKYPLGYPRFECASSHGSFGSWLNIPYYAPSSKVLPVIKNTAQKILLISYPYIGAAVRITLNLREEFFTTNHTNDTNLLFDYLESVFNVDTL